jgi:hypothetical protein
VLPIYVYYICRQMNEKEQEKEKEEVGRLVKSW